MIAGVGVGPRVATICGSGVGVIVSVGRIVGVGVGVAATTGGGGGDMNVLSCVGAIT